LTLTIVGYEFSAFVCICVMYMQAVEDKYMEAEEMRSCKTMLSHLDKLFTVTFALEMLLKMTAYGPRRYFTDAWCWLDFIIVAVRIVLRSR